MYKLIGTNSVQRLADGACIPFVNGNTDYEEYKLWLEEGNVPEPEFTEEEVNTQRIQAIKAKASELIKNRYPIEKQSSAQLGIYGEQYLMDMKEYIAKVIAISNEAEANCVKVEDIQWQ